MAVQPTGSDGKRFLAMLPLERPVQIDGDALLAKMRSLYPTLPYALHVSKGEGETSVVMIDKTIVGVMMMDLPAPKGVFDAAVGGQALWPEAQAEFARHRAHIILYARGSFSDHEGAVEHAMAVTFVACALAHLVPALGLYWSTSETATSLARAKEIGPELAKGKPPADVWVRCYFSKDSAPIPPLIGAATRGLHIFLGREIEIEPAPMPLMAIGERLIGLITYLLQKGPVLKDGETAGVTADEHFRIRHLISKRLPGVPVFSMLLEQTDLTLGAEAAAPIQQSVTPMAPKSEISANLPPHGTPATRSFGRRKTPI